MSSSSTVTYTSVYTDSEPGRVFWGANEELSDEGSLRVIVYVYDGLPMQPIAPQSPDFVPGPEHPSSPDYVPGPEHPPSPVEVPYVPKPEYPEYLVSSDAKAPLEDQPLPADASPTALSPGYVVDSDPDEDSEEDPVEDHADYPADGGDDDDEPSDDDDDDDTDDDDEEPFEDEDDDEEEGHLAPADSSAVPVTHLRRARKTVRLEPPMSPSMEACIVVYAAAPAPPSPPPSPLSPWESSTAAPRPTGGHRADYGFIDTTDTEIRRQRAEEVSYGIRDVWVDPTEAVEEVAPTILDGVNARVTELGAVQEQDTQDVYAVIEDTQDRQTKLFQSGDGLVEDRQFHYKTARLLDRETLVSREAWLYSVGLSSAIHYELQAYRTQTQMHDYRIASQESLMTTLIAQVSSLQGQLSAALGQIQALQARDQTHADNHEGAGSSA
ncbi:hypothetical protein Tco_0186357 [Tanacetum coccineum]